MTNTDYDNSREWAAQAYALLKKQQEALNKVMGKQKREKLLDEYNDKKCEILSRCTNVDVFNRLNEALDDITEEDILSEGQLALKNKLLKKLEKFEKEEKIRVGMLNTEKSNIF